MSINVKEIKSFLSNFTGAFICQKKTNTAKAGFKKVTVSSHINDNDDVYFYVNGGPKESDIRTINAFFIDLDAGRDKNKKYLSPSKVSKKRPSMLKRIGEFPVAPSMIVETRNGYQVYWLTKIDANTLNKEKWKLVERRIQSFFKDVGGDISCLRINQILRVPGTTWYKRYEKTSDSGQVQIRLIKKSKSRYTLDKMLKETTHIKIITNQKPQHESIPKQMSPIVSPVSDDIKTDVIEFLNEVAGLLYSKGAKFSSKQARALAIKLLESK